MRTRLKFAAACFALWMARNGVRLSSISLGIVYLWFGFLKFLPDNSPLHQLVAHTISTLTMGRMAAPLSLRVLATWECLIGLGFLTGRAQKATFILFFLQLPGTVLPMIYFPHEVWIRFPYEPTLIGQNIIKNMVLASAGLIVLSTQWGARFTVDQSVVDTVENLPQLRKASRRTVAAQPVRLVLSGEDEAIQPAELVANA